jgi:nucleoside-diphosphate kinase
MAMGEEAELTLALIKPDAVRSGFAPEILRIIASKHTIISVHAGRWTPVAVDVFYSEHAGKPFFEDLKAFMSSDIIYSVVMSGPNVVASWRELMGPTDPQKAPMHTLRCMFGDHKGPLMRNAVHGSDSVESAAREIRLIREFIRGDRMISAFGRPRSEHVSW